MSWQDIEAHVAFVITVPTALAIFLSIFVLVCIESVFKKLLRVFSLVIWACLVAMGYLFMFFGGIICPWDQVRRDGSWATKVAVFIHDYFCLRSLARNLFMRKQVERKCPRVPVVNRDDIKMDCCVQIMWKYTV